MRPKNKCRLWRMRKQRHLRGSFTIEAALLVPLILAVLFLLLQVILYLHDTVAVEAWLYQETWKHRWNEEQDRTVFEEDPAPVLAVLRSAQVDETQKGTILQWEARFETHLLPDFVTMLWQNMPSQTRKRSTEHCMDSGRFVRITGAILEEGKEIGQ